MIRTIGICLLLLLAGHGVAQTEDDSVLQQGSLRNCIRFALAHQPVMQQSRIDEEITEHIISNKLSDWYPHLGFSAVLQRNPQLPVSYVQGAVTRIGIPFTSTGGLSASQVIFNQDVLLASSTAGEVRRQAREQTTGNAISVVVSVSKAFYAVLLAQDQISVLSGDIVRLEQSRKDAENLYRAGIVDKTDFERATVALNNANVELKQSQETLKARMASLKDLMGYPSRSPLALQEDSAGMANDMFMDTTQQVQYENRIEYRLLQTQRQLDQSNLHYYTWAFLPSLSAFAGYTLNYFGSGWRQLYLRSYPSSVIGFELTYPIFEGGKRIQEIDQASLELDRTDQEIIALKNSVDAEYAQAMANYRSNLESFLVAEQNLGLAKDVYHTIQLQYRAGTKSYLEMISAETDLRTAEINKANALYQVLSTKLDVQRALGTVPYVTKNSDEQQ